MTVPPRKILVMVEDGPDPVALDSALALAERHGAALEPVTCVEPPPDLRILARLAGEDPERLLALRVAQARDRLREQLAARMPEPPAEPRVLVGKAYLEIIRHVARSGCDFVVKTAEPLSGVTRFLLASTDQHLLRKCPCPVWLQTAGAPPRPRRILAAVDLDLSDAAEPDTLADLNRRVVATARQVAAADGAEVTVLHAWDAVGEGMLWAFSGGDDARMSVDRYVNEILGARQAAMDRFLATLDPASGPRLVPRRARGAPETVIRAQSRAPGTDLVVIGTVARTGMSGVFIGNTAENIINSIECPVLAVKPAGFTSPLLRD
ncbi:universal stress protein [Pseudoponticoccus marisrubri]|uniref:Universal stress protein UspA n=1 Tax=Pseudoponticoccus marisrubri TaxID=1685382 RepID=A0A0W7WIG9_9RHOB|nr:universal stress protein [Pseudoponticoccus marisrubri]KUF10334.1 universal stress protein UspA [Pseudoponticoccus marisrubri]